MTVSPNRHYSDTTRPQK